MCTQAVTIDLAQANEHIFVLRSICDQKDVIHARKLQEKLNRLSAKIVHFISSKVFFDTATFPQSLGHMDS